MGTPYNGAIFSTIWTAGAIATYDLSNFSQNQVDDMNPGGWMRFSTSQLADLNYYAPLKPNGEIFAQGNIYNALLYNGDHALADHQPHHRLGQRHDHRQRRGQSN